MTPEIWKRTEWFREARFGMFIHWGLYAIPARGEWVRSHEELSIEEYEPYFHQFNPVDYNPRKWVKMAKVAGMKYIGRNGTKQYTHHQHTIINGIAVCYVCKQHRHRLCSVV